MSDDDLYVGRKVYFFRIGHFAQFKEVLPGAFQRIENLPFTDEGRYQKDNESSSRICVFPDSLSYPLRIRLGRTRRSLLPDVEREGQLKMLELHENEGLIDVCHIVFFEDGFVAAEFNYDGPKISKLSKYIYAKGYNLPGAPQFLPLFERNISDVISALDNVKVVDLTVPPSAAAMLRQADNDLASAVEVCASAGASKKVSLSLVSDLKTSKLHQLSKKLASMIGLGTINRDEVDTLRVTGFSNGSTKPKFIDLLEEKLVTVEMFRRSTSRSRSINSDQAYDLIERCYAERRDKLSEYVVAGDLW